MSKDLGRRRAQQPDDPGKGIFALLTAGAQHTGQDFLRASALPGAVAAPDLARNHHTPQGPLVSVVGGVQAGTPQKSE
jgi:hypothetical protein